MTTTVAFESATIADAIKKAAKIAPSKAGAAFDKAHGIIFDVYPDEEIKVVVRATNEEIFYSEAVAVETATGATVRWRMSSGLLAHVANALGKNVVTFTQDGGKLEIKCGRMKAVIPLIDPEYYPNWDSFDPSTLTQVADLGSKLARVEWAASGDGQPPMCGIYLDGESASATNRYRIARTPCKVDIEHPVIIPPGISGIIRQMGDVGVGVEGTNLLLSPDPYTQIRTVIFDSAYPPVGQLLDMHGPDKHSQQVEVGKEQLVQYINNSLGFAGAERNPMVKTYWGKGEIAVYLSNENAGSASLFGDVIEVPNQIGHKRTLITFSPKHLLPALSNAPSSKVTIHYSDDNPYKPMFIDGGSGYEVIVMPIKEIKPTE